MQHWACFLEKHHNGGNHYHVALKLTGPKRCKSVKESITSSEGIVANFSDQHGNYHSAYRYICKEDTSVHNSKHHPNLENVSSHESRSQQKLTGTLAKPSPPKPPLFVALLSKQCVNFGKQSKLNLLICPWKQKY